MVALSRWLWSQRSGSKVLLALALVMLLPLAFIPATERFAAATSGAQPFDMHFVLTPAEMHAQLRAWTPAAKAAYREIALVDFVFPPAFGLALALAWAWLLARLPGGVGERVANRGLLPLAFSSAAFDWAENVGNLLFIDGHASAAYLALFGKYGKQTALLGETIVTLLLIGLALRAAVRARTRPAT